MLSEEQLQNDELVRNIRIWISVAFIGFQFCFKLVSRWLKYFLNLILDRLEFSLDLLSSFLRFYWTCLNLFFSNSSFIFTSILLQFVLNLALTLLKFGFAFAWIWFQFVFSFFLVSIWLKFYLNLVSMWFQSCVICFQPGFNAGARTLLKRKRHI